MQISYGELRMNIKKRIYWTVFWTLVLCLALAIAATAHVCGERVEVLTQPPVTKGQP